MRIAVVALGPSGTDYVRVAETAGDKKQLFDEVWAINGFGGVLQCDRTFHMDDVRVQEKRAEGGNQKIGNMLKMLKQHPGPVYTSRVHPDYPSLVEYPLEAVINATRCRPYFNNTVAYAIALAISGVGLPENVTELSVYGADFTYPNAPTVEKGRGCCEYWIGIATAKGIDVSVPHSSSLMGACEGTSLYGYDTQRVSATMHEDGNVRLEFIDTPVPTAEEIERRYYKGPPLQ